MLSFVRHTLFSKFEYYYYYSYTLNITAIYISIYRLKQKGYEVLYVSEPIDEMTLQNIEKYEEVEIVDAGM